MDWKGSGLINTTMAGQWQNSLSNSGHDLLEFTVESLDSRLVIDEYIHWETAGELDNELFTMGSISFDSHPGAWHTQPSSAYQKAPQVSSALVIEQTGQFLDSTYVAGVDSLHAVVYADPDYSIISINVTDGTVTVLSAAGCAQPHTLAYDGSQIWITGKAQASDTDYGLFRYTDASLDTLAAGYLVSHADLENANALSFCEATLYCHNGSILFSAIGTIEPATGKITNLLSADFGSLPGLARPKKLPPRLTVFTQPFCSRRPVVRAART